MITNPQALNKNQSTLRATLTSGAANAIDAFLDQHACLHSATVAPGVAWSYEDQILDDLSETLFRRIPAGEEHSIAWCLWHITRIEDVTMNILLAGEPQFFYAEGFFEAMKTPFRDTGNAFSVDRMEELSQRLDFPALRDYRVAVGKKTRQIISHLEPADLKKKLDHTRFQRMLDEGAVTPETHWLIDYWSGLTIAGLLLMPPSRHCLSHLNEAARLKKKRA